MRNYPNKIGAFTQYKKPKAHSGILFPTAYSISANKGFHYFVVLHIEQKYVKFVQCAKQIFK